MTATITAAVAGGNSPSGRPALGSVRPADGSCSQRLGDAYCATSAGTTRYQQGWRCTAHNPRTLAGLPPLPDSPGIPAYRIKDGR